MREKSLLVFFAVLCCLYAAAVAKINFLAVGDWGDLNRTAQLLVAEQMGVWAEDNGCDFIISTGDNFYPDGVESNQSNRFDYNWRDVYDHPAIADVTWYISLGNHDYGPDFQELYQVEYSEYEPRWVLPGNLWHSFVKSSGDVRTHVIAVDTHALSLKAYDNDAQLTWLEEELESSSEGDWVFVFGHHPAVSASFTSGDPLTRDLIVPLLERYDVPFFINGHDHNLEHITEEAKHPGGVHHVISGGGGQVELTEYNGDNHQVITELGYELEYFSKSHGFVAFEVDRNETRVSFINEKGKVLYQFSRAKDIATGGTRVARPTILLVCVSVVWVIFSLVLTENEQI